MGCRLLHKMQKIIVLFSWYSSNDLLGASEVGLPRHSTNNGQYGILSQERATATIDLEVKWVQSCDFPHQPDWLEELIRVSTLSLLQFVEVSSHLQTIWKVTIVKTTVYILESIIFNLMHLIEGLDILLYHCAPCVYQTVLLNRSLSMTSMVMKHDPIYSINILESSNWPRLTINVNLQAMAPGSQ